MKSIALVACLAPLSLGCNEANKSNSQSAGGLAPHAPTTKVVQPVSAEGYEGTWKIGRGQFAEINLVFASGAKLTADFSVRGGVVIWNVHSHQGEETTIHQNGKGSTGAVTFTAPQSGTFSYMWENDATNEVELTVKLAPEGVVRVHSTHPAS